MPKVLTLIGASLIAVLAMQAAAASERGHARKMSHQVASERLRNANAMVWTPQPGSYSGYSGYHGALSAPAGR
jgi:hypothetical protein